MFDSRPHAGERVLPRAYRSPGLWVVEAALVPASAEDTHMARLNDLKLTLLAHAARQDGGSFYPLPSTRSGPARTATAVAQLADLGLAEERETRVAGEVARTDGDVRWGMFITEAGLAAIGLGDAGDDATASSPAPDAQPATAATNAGSSRSTKIGTVLALLGRSDGATLADLVQATGWLPHTTRAALTGLRKKGHELVRGKREGATCYTLGTAGDA